MKPLQPEPYPEGYEPFLWDGEEVAARFDRWLAAERATSEQLTRIAEEVAETYAALDDPQEYLIHDFGFHRAVAAASDNPILAAFMRMVSEVLYQRRIQTVDRAGDLKQSVDMHRRIYRAIRARDSRSARALMSEHLMQAERDFTSEEMSEKSHNETVRSTAQEAAPSQISAARSNNKRRSA